MPEDNNKNNGNPAQYWQVLPNSNDWTMNVVDPQGYYGAYIKGDGCVHLWSYSNPKEDMARSDPTRHVYGDVTKEEYIDEPSEYQHICDLDALIARLQALRHTAIQHFSLHGCDVAKEQWH